MSVRDYLLLFDYDCFYNFDKKKTCISTQCHHLSMSYSWDDTGKYVSRCFWNCMWMYYWIIYQCESYIPHNWVWCGLNQNVWHLSLGKHISPVERAYLDLFKVSTVSQSQPCAREPKVFQHLNIALVCQCNCQYIFQFQWWFTWYLLVKQS